jgi:hypothetical protein
MGTVGGGGVEAAVKAAALDAFVTRKPRLCIIPERPGRELVRHMRRGDAGLR